MVRVDLVKTAHFPMSFLAGRLLLVLYHFGQCLKVDRFVQLDPEQSALDPTDHAVHRYAVGNYEFDCASLEGRDALHCGAHALIRNIANDDVVGHAETVGHLGTDQSALPRGTRIFRERIECAFDV